MSFYSSWSVIVGECESEQVCVNSIYFSKQNANVSILFTLIQFKELKLYFSATKPDTSENVLLFLMEPYINAIIFSSCTPAYLSDAGYEVQ